MTSPEITEHQITLADGSQARVGVIHHPSASQSGAFFQTQELVRRVLTKSVQEPAASKQEDSVLGGRNVGIYDPPFDMEAAKALSKINPHHSTCLRVKRDATVGLGFMDEETRKILEARAAGPASPTAAGAGQAPAQPPSMLMKPNPVETKVDKELDPLCDMSFQDVLNDVAEDYYTLGVGYMEVVRENPRDPTSAIKGLWHVPAERVKVFRRGGHRYHYVVNTDGEEKHWPRFGRVAEFIDPDSKTPERARAYATHKDFSEIIPFKSSSAADPYYALPEWLAAVPTIELNSSLLQYFLDFFHNRGVPEFVMLYKGQMNDNEWQKIVDQLTGNVGLGKSHKSVAIKTPAEEHGGLEIIRLAMDNFNGTEQFKETKDAIDMGIVTAHRVPLLLGGIAIPGKLGANNEFPQQLASFQTLLISHAQRLFQRTLGQTLGNKDYNSGLTLNVEDFELRRITDIIDPAMMDTTARMKQSPQAANAEGRNLADGVKD